ncbi:signal peptidase I [Luteimonas aestuarii]|uniref:Signal peptidase I n=2 Tax=Luteimonas aestuarii TaxID=453837 RepID=A0A4R5TJE9_9GAMM|nr:signal peptidase I [Luteimonas aestuarii]TDK20520.1 signal peptidase I [Luteimonas aestuarii]
MRMLREHGPLLLLILLMMVARSSFANHYQVPSGSMQPTLQPGDRVVVDMSAYGLRLPFTGIEVLARGAPAPGDVVVFKSPGDGTRLIKRVVAVEGQTVALQQGRLWIDGRPLQVIGDGDAERVGGRVVQLDLAHGGGPDIVPLTIPEGQVLVLGDHRGNSVDGRYFGLVPADALYAKAVGVYWRRGEGPVWKRL